ncbi:hypothetical protein [Streptomyces sp. NPDC052042]|uniref:hypothetical protein n=1 Tax=Streptomyces sp. NPDC052042 TaxID=3365683 RepID=UPI0037D1D89D
MTRPHTFLPALAVTAVTVFGVGVAAPAVAAPTTVQSVSPARQATGHDVYRDWYASETNCKQAGIAGIERGHWDSYSCAPGRGGLLWHLWSNR